LEGPWKGLLFHLKEIDALPEIPILYQDDFLAVANKPAGLLTQALGVPGVKEANLEAALSLQLGYPVWVAHRLDRATSGLVLISKAQEHLPPLQGLFQKRQVQKEYRAVVVGSFEDSRGKIDTPLSVPHEPGKEQKALTEYRVLSSHTFLLPHHRPDRLSLTEMHVTLHTGRKHQIRRHFGGIGYPLLGDMLYGQDNYNRVPPRVWQVNHLWLHSHRLAFRHPILDTALNCAVEPPANWQPVLRHMSPFLP